MHIRIGKKEIKAGIGLPALLGIVGGLVAVCTIPGFGIGLAALVGLGTWLGATGGAIAGFIGGGIVGGIGGGILGGAIGALTGRAEGVGTGLVAGGAILGIGGALLGGATGLGVGAVKAYDWTAHHIQTKACAGSFNVSACPKDAHADSIANLNAKHGPAALPTQGAYQSIRVG